jgi:hypothetical protein
MISVCCIFPDDSEGTHTFPVFPVGGDTLEIKGICPEGPAPFVLLLRVRGTPWRTPHASCRSSILPPWVSP